MLVHGARADGSSWLKVNSTPLGDGVFTSLRDSYHYITGR